MTQSPVLAASQPGESALPVPGGLLVAWCQRQLGLVGAWCRCRVVPVPGGSVRAWYWCLKSWSECSASTGWCRCQEPWVERSAGAGRLSWSVVLLPNGANARRFCRTRCCCQVTGMERGADVQLDHGAGARRLGQSAVPMPGGAGAGRLDRSGVQCQVTGSDRGAAIRPDHGAGARRLGQIVVPVPVRPGGGPGGLPCRVPGRGDRVTFSLFPAHAAAVALRFCHVSTGSCPPPAGAAG